VTPLLFNWMMMCAGLYWHECFPIREPQLRYVTRAQCVAALPKEWCWCHHIPPSWEEKTAYKLAQLKRRCRGCAR